MSVTRTQYGIDYNGRELGIQFDTREDVDTYIAVAVATRGTDPAAYAVKHRTITWGDWASTTPAPATLAARQDGGTR